MAVHARDGYAYDYQRRILSFTMTAREKGVGIYFPSHEWEFEGGVRWSKMPLGGPKKAQEKHDV